MRDMFMCVIRNTRRAFGRRRVDCQGSIRSGAGSEWARLVTKVHWHRVVLDECQMIKTPTDTILTLCDDLPATHRFGAFRGTRSDCLARLTILPRAMRSGRVACVPGGSSAALRWSRASTIYTES